MKPLYSARHIVDAHWVRGHLEAHGVAAIVRGEFLSGAIGELPADVCKVWVVEDHQFDMAADLLREITFRQTVPQSMTAWHCNACGETLEPQFTQCWKCGGESALSST